MGGIDLGMVNKGGEDSDDDIFGVGVSTAAGAPESPTSPSSPSSPTPYASTVGSRSRSRSISPADTIVTSITDIIDRTLECPDDDPFLVDSDSDCEDSIKIGHGIGSQDLHPIETLDEKDPAEDQGHTLVPSPLQVRKSKTARPLSLFLPSFVTEKSRASVLSLPSTQAQNTTPNTPRPLPPLPNARSRNGTKARHEDTDADGFLLNRTQTFRQRELPPLPSINKHIRTYNASLAFLHTQISRTITHIQSQIQDLTTLQQARAISRRSGSFQRSVSFWSFSPVKDKNKGRDSTSSRQLSSCPQDSGISSSSSKRERLADRIARLRAEGWQTVGLKNPERGWKGEEYYQEFCGMALDELYLG
ncbi:hypothetical protein BDW74DRAFT_157141 [Aspergillus multicolor]|uniref:uncharacterized protein n=1 Tax=Aspergillus multicolor TaxID=41759 RepID=UPI003CCDBE51